MRFVPRFVPRFVQLIAPASAALALVGCGRDPSVEISGSFFPAWMISILAGLVATLIAKRIFLATRIDAHLTPQLVIYGALMLCFTLLTWLIFYW
jgi:hypothetical protein